MRRRLLAALTLLLGLSLVGGVDAEPTVKKGNWFTRLFSKQAPKKEAEPSAEDLKRLQEASAANVANLRAQAEAAFHRRVAVCDKLQGIAAANNDDDLKRKADSLNQFAWKLYMQQTGPPPKNLQTDEAILERGLGLSGTRRTTSSPNTSPIQGSRAEAKED